jgi:hypothetical protein
MAASWTSRRPLSSASSSASLRASSRVPPGISRIFTKAPTTDTLMRSTCRLLRTSVATMAPFSVKACGSGRGFRHLADPVSNSRPAALKIHDFNGLRLEPKPLSAGHLKHEVRWKPVRVAPDALAHSNANLNPRGETNETSKPFTVWSYAVPFSGLTTKCLDLRGSWRACMNPQTATYFMSEPSFNKSRHATATKRSDSSNGTVSGPG